jgi:hypothetical protein
MNQKKDIKNLIRLTDEYEAGCNTGDIDKCGNVLCEMITIIRAWPTRRRHLRQFLIGIGLGLIATGTLIFLLWLLLHVELPPLEIVETWRY